jgi:hypothetical protein
MEVMIKMEAASLLVTMIHVIAFFFKERYKDRHEEFLLAEKNFQGRITQ